MSPLIPLVFAPVALVQPNGDLTIVYNAWLPLPGLEVVQTSRDGGDHFDPPVTIESEQRRDVPGLVTSGFGQGVNFPAATVDPATGYLYAAWEDGRFPSDGQNDIVQ